MKGAVAFFGAVVMLERLLRNLEGRCRVRPYDRVVIGCSGGADSVALSFLLARLASSFPLRLHLAHLDHALRPDSAVDADFVSGMAERLHLPFHHARIEVNRVRRRGENLEAAARRVRRDFLRQVADEVGAEHVALAHHRLDQAETILFRLVRGAGTNGLTGMAWCDPPFIRPLLDIHPDSLRTWLRREGLSWREDPSNADLNLSRNRLRHEVLPRLEAINSGAVDHLVAFGERMAVDETFWSEQVDAWLARELCEREGAREVAATALGRCPRALRMRIWLRLLRLAAGRQVDLTQAHLEACDRLLDGASQSDCHLPGLWVGRRYDRILVAVRAPEPPGCWQVELSGPGSLRLPGGALLRAEIASEAGRLTPNQAAFDLSSLEFPLVVRNRRPGDRFRPEGGAGERKLKDVFIDARVPREKRDALPLLLSGEHILWVAGFRRSSLFCPVRGEKVLILTLEPAIKA
ncbi:MAG: tRNA lysidine(34) synthetase TilS [Deltaproteobacteria bacterium]|nr:MAG: tRNA lysidine(34) synthetase TilS [Deltaproteobacteria bacterium]